MEIIKSRPSTNGGSFVSVLLLNCPSFLAGLQGRELPQPIPLLDSSSSFWICSFGMCCSLSLEGSPPLVPTPCTFLFTSASINYEDLNA